MPRIKIIAAELCIHVFYLAECAMWRGIFIFQVLNNLEIVASLNNLLSHEGFKALRNGRR